METVVYVWSFLSFCWRRFLKANYTYAMCTQCGHVGFWLSILSLHLLWQYYSRDEFDLQSIFILSFSVYVALKWFTVLFMHWENNAYLKLHCIQLNKHSVKQKYKHMWLLDFQKCKIAVRVHFIRIIFTEHI